MKAEINLRAFTRIRTKVSLDICLKGSRKKQTGYTQNVSMNGFAVEGLPPIPLGEIIDVVFHIGGLDSGVKVEVTARISNIVGHRMGAEIISHLTVESYNHLQKLVLYRSGDGAELIEGEIARQKEKS